MDILSISEIKKMDDNAILDYLKESLNIPTNEEISVWGLFDVSTNYTNDKNYHSLKSLRLKNNDEIEYPISDLNSREKIEVGGVYIQYEKGEELNSTKKELNTKQLFLSCRLELSDKPVREHRDNPICLRVVNESIKVLKKIPHSANLNPIDFDENIYIEKNILDFYVESNSKEIKLKLNDLKLEKDEAEKNIQDLIDESEKVTNSIKDQNQIKDTIDSDIEKSTKIIEQKDKDVLNLNNIINKHTKTQEKQMAMINQNLEKFRDFVKEKAEVLLKLEFIDEDRYKELLMIKDSKDKKEKFTDFHKDLESSYPKAISYIQSYLFNQNIVYPRYILEDFFALIQTNDLIILAGESGSGKSNLVKSFANAIGGVSKIIPVKPNWTSSEDLLGYYNPLEKKYLATPFLEALIEANRNPDTPYFICLDEMNLARVEYYFADFLSLLEDRSDKQPEIPLYSDDESSHILSEFKNVLSLITSSKEKYKKDDIVDFVKILQDEEINQELKRVFGFSDKDSLIKYHSDLRRMLSGILNTPSSVIFPKNVRIIGTINIDETTHYLSPKILDRAHIMKFDSPLLFDWDSITLEIEPLKNADRKLKFNIEDFNYRDPYPAFDKDNDFCKIMVDYTKKYFTPLGIEVGLRTIRQGLNYQEIFLNLNPNKDLAFNNFILHKILPKMTFDGNKKIKEDEAKSLLIQLKVDLDVNILSEDILEEYIDSIKSIDEIIEKAKSNDWIVNYWA